MDCTRLQTGKSERIEILLLDAANAPVTGAIVTLKIRRKSDGLFFNGSTFVAGPAFVTMAEVDSVVSPGSYFYVFNSAGFTQPLTVTPPVGSYPDEGDVYYLRVESASGANVPQIGEIKVGGYVDFLDKRVSTVQAAGGGYWIGSQFWSEEEKNDVVKIVRKLAGSHSEMQEGQKGLEEVLKSVMGYVQGVEELVKENKAISNGIAESVDSSSKKVGGSLESMAKKSALLIERLSREGNNQRAQEAAEVLQSLEDKVSGIRNYMREIQERTNARMNALEEFIKSNAGMLDDLFELKVKGMSEEDLDTFLESVGGEQ